MPELKNTFTGGRMDKDQDERILDSKSYREALNIEIFTTEDSDIGSAQNILGNIQVTKAIQGPSYDYSNCNVVSIVDNAKNPGFRYAGTNKHIAHAVDPQSDKLYRFINTEPTAENPHGVWMDRIVEYDTNANIQDPWFVKEKSVMVDIYKVATTIAGIEDPPPPPVDPEPDPENPFSAPCYPPCTGVYMSTTGSTIGQPGHPDFSIPQSVNPLSPGVQELLQAYTEYLPAGTDLFTNNYFVGMRRYPSGTLPIANFGVGHLATGEAVKVSGWSIIERPQGGASFASNYGPYTVPTWLQDNYDSVFGGPNTTQSQRVGAGRKTWDDIIDVLNSIIIPNNPHGLQPLVANQTNYKDLQAIAAIVIPPDGNGSQSPPNLITGTFNFCYLPSTSFIYNFASGEQSTCITGTNNLDVWEQHLIDTTGSPYNSQLLGNPALVASSNPP
jgi:hypothetical protein